MRRTNAATGAPTPGPNLDGDGGWRSLLVVAGALALFPVALWASSNAALVAAGFTVVAALRLVAEAYSRRTTDRTREVCVPGTDVCARV